MIHSPRNHDLIWVRDDSPINEGKYAVLSKLKSGTIIVDEVENGFKSEDKMLMDIIESYWYCKNKQELNELLYKQRDEEEITCDLSYLDKALLR